MLEFKSWSFVDLPRGEAAGEAAQDGSCSGVDGGAEAPPYQSGLSQGFWEAMFAAMLEFKGWSFVDLPRGEAAGEAAQDGELLWC